MHFVCLNQEWNSGVTAESGGTENHNLLIWNVHSSWNSPLLAAAYGGGTKEIGKLSHFFKGVEKHLLLLILREKSHLCVAKF